MSQGGQMTGCLGMAGLKPDAREFPRLQGPCMTRACRHLLSIYFHMKMKLKTIYSDMVYI